MRSRRLPLLLPALLCAGLSPVGHAVAGTERGLTIALDEPTPLLAYDMRALLADGGLATGPIVRVAARPREDDKQLDCLSAAIYFEARSESPDGQRAVAQVVLNRVGRRGFPASVCGVVYQGAGDGRGCQFNFVCNGAMAARKERGAWMAARRIAQAVIGGDVLETLRGATFFHARSARPDWSSRMVRVATIGSHIFYRRA